MMNSPRRLKGMLALLCLLGGVSAVVGYRVYLYPHGRRPGGVSLPGVYGALLTYAQEHNGWFPDSDQGQYRALQLLYNEYCPSGRELAGVSGNPDRTADALRSGTALSSNLSSWVYVPGLRSDDPGALAILWDSKPGLYHDGRRNSFGGRAVLFASGSISNVPAMDWDRFERKQRELRLELQSKRATMSGERLLRPHRDEQRK